MAVIREHFKLAFLGFVRTSLESEFAISVRSLSESTGLPEKKVEALVKRGIAEGLLPGYFDDDTREIVVDTDRADVSTLARRKKPILSQDIEDPGAWDLDLDDDL